jgi:hypothetical protein
MFQTKAAEKIKTHAFLFNNLFPENRAVYEIMCKYMIRQDRPQYCFSAPTIATPARLNVTSYVQYIVCLVKNSLHDKQNRSVQPF